MAHKAKDYAAKAMKGDKEAMGVLILMAPKGHMGDMSDEAYASKVDGDDKYAAELDEEEDEEYGPEEEMDEDIEAEHDEEKIELVSEALAPFITDDEEQTAAARAVCDALYGPQKEEGNPGPEYKHG